MYNRIRGSAGNSILLKLYKNDKFYLFYWETGNLCLDQFANRGWKYKCVTGRYGLYLIRGASRPYADQLCLQGYEELLFC